MLSRVCAEEKLEMAKNSAEFLLFLPGLAKNSCMKNFDYAELFVSWYQHLLMSFKYF